MSVKGFLISGNVERYDYNALDNLPTDTGLSDEAKQALLACFENVAWINDQGQTYYDALEAALYPTGSWSVINALTNCTTSNSATTVADGNAYNAVITADSGYTLEGATVSITMGGTAVTGYYNNGTISIPSVTGDLVITVTATSAVTGITAVFTQGDDVYGTNTDLEILKDNLVVTANLSDSTTETIPAENYTLSGTMAIGTSTITASYGGKTATFSVTVDFLFVVLGDQLTRGRALFHEYPYYGTSNDAKRISYLKFDLLCSGGKTYECKCYATTGSSTPRMGTQFYNQLFLDAVQASQNATTSDYYDPGWHTSYDDGIVSANVTVPATVNSSPIAGLRMTFSLMSNANIPSSFQISKITIKEAT